MKGITLNDEKLRSSLLSYTFAQENSHENLNELQEFLRVSGIGTIDINDLRKKVDRIKEEKRKIKQDQERMAKLFVRDKKVRVYRYGSDFCPKCHMFKNYKKECPYCKYLEITM